ncbi:MAG: hypothetical protein V7785_22185 [Bermanella sp.]
MKYSALIIIIFCSTVFANDNFPCDFSATKPISFRSGTSTDSLKITIKGYTCKTSKLTYSILTDKGELIYEFTDPKTKDVSVYGKPTFQSNVFTFFEWFLKWPLKSTSELPERVLCDKAKGYCNEFKGEENYAESKLTIKEYNELKERNTPMFTHNSGHESWTTVAYDKESGKYIVVLSGGV